MIGNLISINVGGQKSNILYIEFHARQFEKNCTYEPPSRHTQTARDPRDRRFCIGSVFPARHGGDAFPRFNACDGG